MAQKTIIPTRMELTRQKKKLLVARRGHKLLKDKRDEMMKHFLRSLNTVKQVRKKVDNSLKKIQTDMQNASAQMSSKELSVSLMYPKERLRVAVSYDSILNLKVPNFYINKNNNLTFCPYGLAFTYKGLDNITQKLLDLFKNMLELAKAESTCRILSIEIQKTNRRVNALKHVVIPQASSTIKFITSKIEELELSTAIRLLKVKDMMVNK